MTQQDSDTKIQFSYDVSQKLKTAKVAAALVRTNKKSPNMVPAPKNKSNKNNKLKRMFTKSPMAKKVPSPLGKLKKRPHVVVTERISEAGLLTYAMKSSNSPNVMPYMYPILKKARENEEFQQEIDCFSVVTRRHPDGTDSDMPQSLDPDEEHPFFAILTVLPDPETNTAKNAERHGKKLTEIFNRVAREEFKYPSTFQYEGDISDPERLKLPNEVLLNRDVMKLMDAHYPPDTYSAEERAENLAEAFFGNWEGAHEYILSYDDVGGRE